MYELKTDQEGSYTQIEGMDWVADRKVQVGKQKERAERARRALEPDLWLAMRQGLQATHPD